MVGDVSRTEGMDGKRFKGEREEGETFVAEVRADVPGGVGGVEEANQL